MKQVWLALPLAGSITIGSLFVLPLASAQIASDGTLPTQVNHQGNLWEITGGGEAGNNLFHSFKDFSLPTGNEAFFNNAPDVVNIINRVTGGNLSNIDGLLRANGTANLFLINPAGILFGENARLDLGGSFFGSTADGLLFDDGTKFSATDTQTPPLLTINAPIGLNLRGDDATITNRGNLTVSKDLTLAGGNLELFGQIQAGEDLTLQATDTVKIRDSAVNPFIAAAGGKLLIEGDRSVDIFALNHNDSGFFSSGDLVLRSNNSISGDAHFYSSSNFRIEQIDGSLGNLVSFYDPVIRTAGDVSFQNYQGTSLHIFAGGKIEVPGNITITGTDTTANSIQENVTLSDGRTLVNIDGSSKPTLDLRAGTTAINQPEVTGELIGFTSNPIVTNPTGTSADLIIGGNIINNGGTVFLTNQYQPNPSLSGGIIQVGGINTSNTLGDGGDIIIDSRGGVNLQGNVDASAFKFTEVRTLVNQPVPSITANSGNGGNITIFANENIIGQNLNSFAQVVFNLATDVQNETDAQGIAVPQATGISGNGGAITIKSKGNLNLNSLNSSSSIATVANVLNPNNFSLINTSLDFQIGNGGKVQINADGNLNTKVIDSSVFAFFNINNQVQAIATNGINRDSQINLNADTKISSGGAVDLISGGDLNLGLVRSSVGAIARVNNKIQASGTNPTIASGNVQLNLNNQLEGNGGAITLTSGGAIDAGELNSSLFTISNAASVADVVADNDSTVRAVANHNVTVNSNALGANGLISLSAAGNIKADNLNFVAATTQATNDLIPIARSLTDNSVADAKVTGTNNVRLSRSAVNLQPISITTAGNLNLGNIFAKQIDLSAAGNLTTGSLEAPGKINLNSSNGSITTGNLNSTDRINFNARRDIIIEIAQGDLNLNNASFVSNAGNIELQGDNINLNNSKLQNSTGNINLITGGNITLRNNSTIATNAPESNINLNAKYLITDPSQDNGNDIIANNGGKINFNVDSVFNLETNSRLSDTNDIVSNSITGLDKTFLIVVPEVDVNREQIQFSENYLNHETLTRLNCPVTTPQIVEDLKIVTSNGVIYPAQAIVHRPDGKVFLTAEPIANTQQRNSIPVNCQ